MTTIRGRLLAMLLTGLAVVLTAGGAAVYWIAQASMMRQLDAGLKTQAQALASLVTYDDGKIEFEFDHGHDEKFTDGYFEFRTPEGELVRRSERLAGASLPIRAELGDEILFEDVELPGGLDGRAAHLEFGPRLDVEYEELAVMLRGPPLRLFVVTAVDRGPVDRALATLMGTLLVVGALVAVTTGVLVAAGVRWGLGPLDRLSRQLGGVSGETISDRIDDAGAPGELVPVYRELNGMLDRVERTLERERSFADAAAHELRTPLAELRTTAEVALKWPDRERATASLREALAIGHEMERLVESLLQISRGHARSDGDVPTATPVGSIVDGCLERAGGRIAEKHLDLTVDLDGNGSLPAPADAAEIIIRNLVDNAVQYTPAGGTIRIRGENGANGSPSLIVENEPVHMDESDLARLFQPFWRMDGSRGDREHAGLGLAVVDQIAQAIGLRVEAGLAGDRLRIRVSGRG